MNEGYQKQKKKSILFIYLFCKKKKKQDEIDVTCVAGVGTFALEFGILSRLTGDLRFEQAALRASGRF